MSFVFYDTETTGIDTAFDQILQFAAIQTDADLNILDRFEIRSRLQHHVVPAPGAMRVTGITAARLVDSALPSHYEMVRAIRAKLLSWAPAMFIGYNSIEFDEPLLRQALYQTLHPPYLTNTGGNSRSDALKMVQAASIFAPGVIKLPDGKKGQPSFKLDQVAPLNGFDHSNAHDALSDVEATIFICKMLAEQAPELWSSFMRFGQKSAVADHVAAEDMFCFSDFYYGRPYSAIVTSIGANPKNNGEFYVYDLAIDPATLDGLSAEKLAKALERSPKPVRKLKCNASPILMSTEDAPDIAAAKKLPMDELERRVAFLRENEEFTQRLIDAVQSLREDKPPSPHVEEQIYDGFFSSTDQILLEDFHDAPWERRAAIVDRMEDARLQKLGRRLIYAERPDLFEKDEHHRHGREQAQRVLGSNDNPPWLTLHQALSKLEELLEVAAEAEAEFLREHKKLLLDRINNMSALIAL